MIKHPAYISIYSPVGSFCMCCIGSRWFVINAILVCFIAIIDLIKERVQLGSGDEFPYFLAIDVFGILAGVLGVLGGMTGSRHIVVGNMTCLTVMILGRLVLMTQQMVKASKETKQKNIEEPNNILENKSELTRKLIDATIACAAITLFYAFGIYTAIKFRQYLSAVEDYEAGRKEQEGYEPSYDSTHSRIMQFYRARSHYPLSYEPSYRSSSRTKALPPVNVTINVDPTGSRKKKQAKY